MILIWVQLTGKCTQWQPVPIVHRLQKGASEFPRNFMIYMNRIYFSYIRYHFMLLMWHDRVKLFNPWQHSFHMKAVPLLAKRLVLASCSVGNTTPRGFFYKYGLTLITAWISNRLPCKVWNEITYLLKIFNGCFTVDVWEWISNFIQDFITCIITYSLWIKVNACLSKGSLWMSTQTRQ